MAEREQGKVPAGLPTFAFSPARPGSGDLAVLDWYTCQRTGCGGGFAVPQGELLASLRRRNRQTAPCPHCFRASRMPGTGDVQEELA